ncbi:MAG: hypothetical protein ACXQTS_01480 [Candidatus Methanospirareceae archaeon]
MRISIIATIMAVLIFLAVPIFINIANAIGVSPQQGRVVYNNETAIIGETNLSFAFNRSSPIIMKGKLEATWEGGPIISFEGSFDSRYAERYEGLVAGKYRVIDGEGKIRMYVYFEEPSLVIKRIEVNKRESTKVVKGENITFVADTNLDIINASTNISYKLVNPRGVPILIENITLVNGSDTTTINTAQMDIGEYKISIKSDPDTNNGLDTEGPSVSFSIEERSISIEADVKRQAVNEDVIFDITTTYGFTNFNLNVTRGAHTNVEFVEFKFVEGVIKRVELGHEISGRTDEDGKYKAIAYFKEPGIYEITVTDTDANITARETVEIEEFLATVNVERKRYYVGERVNITGYANSGDNITVKVDGEVIKTGASVEGFSCTWNTEGKIPGSYEIGIWVLPRSNPDTDPPDASVTVFLMQGGLSMTVERERVALGDEFRIEGTAPGSDRVDIITISPRGGGGHGLDSTSMIHDAPGITHSIVSVLPDGSFEDEISVDEDADTGVYLIAVLSYGRDATWGRSGSKDVIGVMRRYFGDLAIKTQDQIIEMLRSVTVDQAGSDDLICVNMIKVENPKVELDDIKDVLLGENIIVRGFTNRREGSPIIVTVKGPVELKPKIAIVKRDGSFNVSFSTVSAKIGKYTVTADDGEGHIDTETVEILSPIASPQLQASPTTINSSLTSLSSIQEKVPETINASPLSHQTQEDEEYDRSIASLEEVVRKTQGYEMIFAIIALIIVILMGRRRRG